MSLIVNTNQHSLCQTPIATDQLIQLSTLVASAQNAWFPFLARAAIQPTDSLLETERPGTSRGDVVAPTCINGEKKPVQYTGEFTDVLFAQKYLRLP
jgi:hypothetical protein